MTNIFMLYSTDFYKDKILGIQQPFFFPYIEYFALIAATDYWIVFDTPQYVNAAWINRNRVLDLQKESKFITVPVNKHKLLTPTNEVTIHRKLPWKSRIIAQLSVYKKKAPYFNTVIDFLHETIREDIDRISELNVHTLNETCKYIGIPFNHEVFSKMELNVEKVYNPGDWGKVIVKALGSKQYINAFTGQKFIDKKDYSESGIDVSFLKYNYTPYEQLGRPFLPGLSIIDVMMFNSPEEIRKMLTNYELI